ncbi:hypothetical protein ONE63_004846 [Megalurothrips usitatus]|uniref:SMP-30/Gluconolactonase/LRE-like region domain-containing protein n=1 Tax=Megalurothrips usitatus TaxID=439358 RepID=A0AAV7X512_9NEOP|nr:hypothetical protein ONE63_004846 [Megalurothrips usitatus]
MGSDMSPGGSGFVGAATALLILSILASGAHGRAAGAAGAARAGAAGAVGVRPVTRPGLHTEGPVWYESDRGDRGLLFVDIAGHLLNFYDPAKDVVHSVAFDGDVTLVRPLQGDNLVVAVGRELRVLDWAASNFSALLPVRWPPVVLAAVEQDKPGNRFNDGNVDSRGRVWAGTMGPEPVVGHVEDDQAALYRVTPHADGSPARRDPLSPHSADVDTVLAPVSISNGLLWSLDETLMYYIDTPTRRVDVFDFDVVRGEIANRRPAFDFAANNITGNPDGMTIDADGNLWVACFGGSQVIQVDPRDGRLLRAVPVPASQVTSAALGEPKDASGGDTLYVTSMRKGLSDEELRLEPHAGAVFAVTGLGVRGAWRQKRRPGHDTPPPDVKPSD